MNSIYDLINLHNKDIEKEIRNALKSVKESLMNLEKYQTCKIYASYIFDYLKVNHITCNMVSTGKDLGYSYDHFFVYVPKDEDNQYIIDPTYIQFGKVPEFEKLYTNGYMLLNNEEYKDYLSYIENIKSRHK